MPSAEPCLRLLKDEEDQSTLCFTNYDAEELPQLSFAISKLKVVNLQKFHSYKRLFQIALAMKCYPQIRSLYFQGCHISDLGLVCLALLSLRTTNDELVSLEFVNCRLDESTLETLKFVLRSNLVSNLLFANSTIGGAHGDIIDHLAKGLSENLSLRQFGFYPREEPDCLMRGIKEMLRRNQNITKLTITVDRENLLDLLGAAVILRNLKSLAISRQKIDLQYAEALVTLCLVLKSLRLVELLRCTIDQDAWDYLVLSFSMTELIDEWNLEYCSLKKISTGCGNLQVRKLSITGVRFDLEALSQTVDDIANNESVKVLDLSDTLHSAQDFEKVCDVFLRQNKGPSDLTISYANAHVMMITDALIQNTSVQSLTIANLGDEGVLFARGLADMRGLRKLKFGNDGSGEEKYTKDFFEALKESLELNTTLWTLILCDVQSDDPIAKQHLTWIRYFLAINRVGRRSLMTATVVATGIWARVLERTANDADGIYFVLTGKPDLAACFNRKRRNS